MSSIKLHTPMAYQPPLTPVSEAESDTTETASTSNATSSSATSSGHTSELSYFHPRPLNFSRPRPVDFSPGNRVHHDRSDSSSTPNGLPRVHSLDGISSQRTSSLPSEPLFDLNIEPEDNGKEVVPDSSVDGFSWEGHLKDMKPSKRVMDYDEMQRSRLRSLYKPGISSSSTGAIELPISTVQTLSRSRSASAPQVAEPQSRPSSSKTTSSRTTAPPTIIEQPAEEEWEGEDANSHHTVSDNDDTGELGNNLFKSSRYDISSLTQSEIKKLKKKGINPSLYAEMKAARKGRGKWMNPLVGNTYLS